MAGPGIASKIAAVVTKNRSWEWVGSIRVGRLRLRGGKQDRFVFGDDDGVLVEGGEAAVGGADGPPVAVEGDAAGGCGDDGLDGDDEAFGEEMAGAGIGVIGYARLFVDGAAYAMAA